MNQTKKLLPHSALYNLYYTLIHCHLLYGVLAWGNSNSANKLLTLQKRALRIMNKLPYRAHTDPVYKKEKILKIKDVYQTESVLFIYDYKNNNLLHLSKKFSPIKTNDFSTARFTIFLLQLHEQIFLIDHFHIQCPEYGIIYIMNSK